MAVDSIVTRFWLIEWIQSIKGWQLDAFSPYAIVYCYLEFKLSILKNLKLFSIRVKQLSEPIVLWRKGDGFLALFISIFLRNRSLNGARWFYGEKRKIGKGNLYLIENWLSWNEMCCASDNHNYMCHTCAKEFLRFELQLSSYGQNIKFSRNCPKFHIFTKIVIFQVYLQLFRPTASSQ